MRLLDGNDDELPGVIPNDAERVLTYVAIASPAVCAYRLFSNDSEKAKKLGKNFVTLFNKPESVNILDAIYGKSDEYYKVVLKYCVEGNLQAVIDEWAYVLGEKGETLLATMQKAFIRTSPAQIDTYESFSKGTDKSRMRNHFAVGYFSLRLDDKNIQRAENIRAAFNSPLRPFVLATTSVGQEGLDFHLYCRKICHWNLPSNPIDLDQREGRINRYLCLAIRQSLACDERYSKMENTGDVWKNILEEASKNEKKDLSDLVPFWCLPDGSNTVKIERIVPMYPLSKDKQVYERIEKILTLYRITLGQPRQELLLDKLRIAGLSEEERNRLFINLSPWKRSRKELV
jgi:hypothetical protein